jgi:aminopeptidase N
MSHMWFGDLVSQRWWDDTWLNESFADYMGFEVAHGAAGFAGTRLSFETRFKPEAYAADRRRSTHPVAPLPEEVPDVATAAANFDAISYAKGNAVIRQLVTWLGTEDFLAGVNAHLTRHRFANATLDDLVDALDAVSPRDVRGWAEAWLRSAGHDTIRVERDGDVPVLVRDGTRPHRLRVSAYDDSMTAVGDRWVDLEDEPLPLPDWAGRVVVPNSSGETFARVVLDARSREVTGRHLLAVADPLARGLLWTLAFDLPVPDQLDVVDRHLPAETHPTLVEAVVEHLRRRVLARRVPAGDAMAVQDRLARCFRTGLADGPGEQRALALTSGLALASRDADELRRWLAADRTDQGHALDPALRWSVVHRLAGLGELDAAGIEEERRRDGTVQGDLGAATALAARPTADAKAEAWAAMSEDVEVSNRRFQELARGLWSPEQADLVAPYVAAYVEAAPGLARRGPAFAVTVGSAFPALFLDDGQLDLVRVALRGDVPTVLRRAWEDALDDRA